MAHHHDHAHDGHDHGPARDAPEATAVRQGHAHAHGPHDEHDHHAGHSHAGGHHHHGDPSTRGRAFIVAIALNSIFVAVEFGYGYAANSTALMADAGHNLSDVLGLFLAWAAVVVGRRAPNERFTYGLRSTSILAALGNAMLLLVACGAIGWEAVQRFSQPPAVASVTVMVVAAIGIVVNGLSAWMFVKGSAGDLNIRGAYLHMAADAAVSLGVVVAGLVMLFTGWYWLDPLVSLLIVAVILIGTWGLLRESLHLALNAVPPHIDLSAVAGYLRKLPGVTDIHDLHIWGMSTVGADPNLSTVAQFSVGANTPESIAVPTLQRGVREICLRQRDSCWGRFRPAPTAEHWAGWPGRGLKVSSRRANSPVTQRLPESPASGSNRFRRLDDFPCRRRGDALQPSISVG